MRHPFLIALTLLAATGLSTVSCSSSDSGSDDVAISSERLVATPSRIDFDANGGTKTFELSATGRWFITNIPDWIIAEPREGVGNATVSLTASANTTSEERVKVMKITGAERTIEFSVSQKKSDTPAEDTRPLAKVYEIVEGTPVRTTEIRAELGTDTVVPFRRLNVKDGKLYMRYAYGGDSGKEFNHYFKLRNDGQEEKIEYFNMETDGVVYLSEGEDIAGMTSCNSPNTKIRSSNAAAAYAANGRVAVTALPAGTYKIIVGIYSSEEAGSLQLYADDTPVADFTWSKTNLTELESESITLTEDHTIYIPQFGNDFMGIDYIYIINVQWNYKVLEVCDGHVVNTTTGRGNEGAQMIVPYHEYQTYNQKLYRRDPTGGDKRKEYRHYFTLNRDNQEEALDYSFTGTENVVYLKEGEDLPNTEICNSENSIVRSSYAAAAFLPYSNVELIKLPAGTYKIHAVLFDSHNVPNSFWTFYAGSQEIGTLNCTVVNHYEYATEPFIVYYDTPIIVGKGGDNRTGIDLIYITKE